MSILNKLNRINNFKKPQVDVHSLMSETTFHTCRKVVAELQFSIF